MSHSKLFTLSFAGVLLLGCENSGPSRDFERMVNQSYYQYYKECEFFPDRRAMREPPLGTVPADRIEVSPALGQGMVDDVYVDKNPVLLTSAFVEMGQRKFNVFCAPCHGVLGNGVSVVAQKMTLRKAPSLVSDRIRDFPDGRVFRVITDGYGLMPKYSQELEVVERWAIVAYVRALGIHAAGVSIDHLPEPVRARAEEALK